MKVEYHKFFSKHLGQDFEFKSYGEGGKPLMVFPCSKGRFFDYENFGMIHTIHPYIESKDIQVFSVDSRDSESWFSDCKNEQMGKRHHLYEQCIVQEVIPYIQKTYKIREPFMTTGNSWGGYHCINFALKFPEHFDSTISLSGAYSLRQFLDGYQDESVYFNDMLMYMPNLEDPALLKQLRKSYLIICHGRGSWENCAHEAAELAGILRSKNIPVFYDVWGENYPHDWGSWKEQIQKFLWHLKHEKKLIGPDRKK